MNVSKLLVFFSILLITIGGYCDITGTRAFGMSREHYWTDAIYILLLAIAIHLLWRK